MFQLFQTRDGPFFSIVTLVTLFLLHHQKIFVLYIFGGIVKTFEEKISPYNILYLSLQYIVLKIPKLKTVFVTAVTSLQRDETCPFGNPLSFCAIYVSFCQKLIFWHQTSSTNVHKQNALRIRITYKGQ